ncbi:hypothetical protein HK405_004961 [Cladochytrium tenue]|nr:hypothetical protein HK405_004961 [Cladochytrium tenue]
MAAAPASSLIRLSCLISATRRGSRKLQAAARSQARLQRQLATRKQADPRLREERLAANVPRTHDATYADLEAAAEALRDEDEDDFAEYFKLVMSLRFASLHTIDFAAEFCSIIPDAEFVWWQPQLCVKCIVELAIAESFRCCVTAVPVPRVGEQQRRRQPRSQLPEIVQTSCSTVVPGVLAIGAVAAAAWTGDGLAATPQGVHCWTRTTSALNRLAITDARNRASDLQRWQSALSPLPHGQATAWRQLLRAPTCWTSRPLDSRTDDGLGSVDDTDAVVRVVLAAALGLSSSHFAFVPDNGCRPCLLRASRPDLLRISRPFLDAGRTFRALENAANVYATATRSSVFAVSSSSPPYPRILVAMHLSHRVRGLVQLFHDILLVPPNQTAEHELGTTVELVPVMQVAGDQNLLARLFRLADFLEAAMPSLLEMVRAAAEAFEYFREALLDHPLCRTEVPKVTLELAVDQDDVNKLLTKLNAHLTWLCDNDDAAFDVPLSPTARASRHAVLLQRKRAAQAARRAELDAHLRDVAEYTDRRRRDDEARDREEARRDELMLVEKARLAESERRRIEGSEGHGACT